MWHLPHLSEVPILVNIKGKGQFCKMG